MVARDINSGAGSETVVAGSTGDSASSPSSPITSSRLRHSTGTTTTRAEVSELGESTSQLRFEEAVIGFIRQVGRVFVALAGDRLDLSEECGQFQSWDLAAQELMTRSDRAGMSDALAAKRSRLTTEPGRAESVTPEAAPTEKAGELLIFRPRSRPRQSDAVVTPVTPRTKTVIILHGGREFHTTRERAERFYAWARTVAGSGQAALVPLGHNDGVDLLLVTCRTPLE